MKKVIAALSVGFFLAMTGSMALGFVPGSILWLDAGDNPAHPDGWTNLGTAGGVMPGFEAVPALEPAAGPNGTAAYTATGAGEAFGGDGGPSLFFEDWTIEVWLKRLGPGKSAGDHQILAFIDGPWPYGQCVTMYFDIWRGDGVDTGFVKLFLSATGTGGADNGEHFVPEVDIGIDEWHQLAFTFDDSNGTVRCYLDAELVGEMETIQDYSKETEMIRNGIFKTDPDEAADRVFNGSISIVRLYDKVLSDAEILENFNDPRTSAVEPADKLAATWGKVKMSH